MCDVRGVTADSAPLSGRTALVVGGSGGIGSAIAARLAHDGARVVVTYARSRPVAEFTVALIAGTGGEARAIQGDTSTESGCRALVEEAGRAFGPPEIAVYAAGVDLWRLVEETTLAQWRHVQDVNLQGAFFVAQCVLPGMVRRGWGRIINIGSVWGEVGAAGEVAYSASKAGLHGLTKALAKEVARSGVTVNAVAPGVIDTAMNDRFDEAEQLALKERVPLGRIGRPSDVAAAVAFLARAEAGYVTGHVLSVNGGFDPLP